MIKRVPLHIDDNYNTDVVLRSCSSFSNNHNYGSYMMYHKGYGITFFNNMISTWKMDVVLGFEI